MKLHKAPLRHHGPRARVRRRVPRSGLWYVAFVARRRIISDRNRHPAWVWIKYKWSMKSYLLLLFTLVVTLCVEDRFLRASVRHLKNHEVKSLPNRFRFQDPRCRPRRKRFTGSSRNANTVTSPRVQKCLCRNVQGARSIYIVYVFFFFHSLRDSPR